MTVRIPFNKAFQTGRELDYIADVLQNSTTAGDGVYTRRCQSFMEERFSANKVLLTTSCTSALEMAVMLADLRPGDEVILPSFTFVSTANAVVRAGITPRFVDIRHDTKNIDERLIEAAVSEKTKAILPVHYAGVSCEMDEITRIASQHGLRIIEDAAQGVDAAYGKQFLGTIGDLGAYSFHETKNFSCGEGGAILVNDETLVERAEIIREKGTDRSRFARGLVDKYTWRDVGSSFLPSDILAALLYAQFERMEDINARRSSICERYQQQLQPLAERGVVELPYIPANCRTNHHMYYLLAHDRATRDALISHLADNGILAVFHYVPLHNSPMGTVLGCDESQLPVTCDVSDRLLRLPLYCDLSEAEVDFICDAVHGFFGTA